MEYLADSFRDLLAWLVGSDVASIKRLFFENGFEHLWVLLRDHLLSVKLYLGGLIPCLILERYFAVYKRQRVLTANLLVDFSFPVLAAVLFVAPAVAFATGAIKLFYDTYLPQLNLHLLDGQPLWIQVVGAFLIVDFTLFVSHFLRHKITWLWYAHTIHHSQRDLNPLTTLRTHPLEDIINVIIGTLPIAVVGGSYPAWMLFATVNYFWGFFIHSNVKLDLGWLRYVIVSPQYHRIHHSIETQHWDKNFGERLTLWDVIFGTAYFGEKDEYPQTGVAGCSLPDERSRTPWGVMRSWFNLMIYPFKMIGLSLLSVARARPAS